MFKDKYKKLLKIFTIGLVLTTVVACGSSKPSVPSVQDNPTTDVEVPKDDPVVDSEVPEAPEKEEPVVQAPSSELTEAIVSFIDVGQGDGQLIEANDLVVLVDAGTAGNADKIMKMLRDKGISKIDYIIGTHPHADHIGGLPKIIDNYEVANIVLPKVADKDVPTTKIYNSLLTSIANEPGINVIQPEYGKTLYISDDKNTELTILSNEDAGVRSGNLNNYSVTLMFRHGETKFLFTGDAEQEQETHILANVNPVDLKADVFAAGHHGSNTSNTKKFMEAVNPDIVVISAKEGNKYNHPNIEALDIFNSIGAKVYQTMERGDIIVTTNGLEVKVK